MFAQLHKSESSEICRNYEYLRSNLHNALRCKANSSNSAQNQTGTESNLNLFEILTTFDSKNKLQKASKAPAKP
jgi:hypothetical protein